MFRVKLGSGEEAAFRTIDELALGLQSGIITEASEIFDSEAGWRPLSSHPDYAAAKARSLEPLPPAEPLVTLPPVEPVVSPANVPQVVQIKTLSGLELEQRRRRPFWRRHGPSIAAVAAFAVIIVGLTRPIGRHSGELDPETRRPARLVPPHTPGTEEDLGLSPVPVITVAMLTRRYQETAGQLHRSLRDTVGLLGLLTAPESAWASNTDAVHHRGLAFGELDSLLVRYELRLQRVKQAYRDTADYVQLHWPQEVGVGQWAQTTLNPEPVAVEARIDSLIQAGSTLYRLLDAPPGGIVLAGDRVRFADPGTSRAYTQSYARLQRLSADGDLTSRTPALTVMLETVRLAAFPLPDARP
jgi:hypothetical protein